MLLRRLESTGPSSPLCTLLQLSHAVAVGGGAMEQRVRRCGAGTPAPQATQRNKADSG